MNHRRGRRQPISPHPLLLRKVAMARRRRAAAKGKGRTPSAGCRTVFHRSGVGKRNAAVALTPPTIRDLPPIPEDGIAALPRLRREFRALLTA